MGRISAEIEAAKAKIEAIKELRKTDSEQLTQIREQIGELRSTILDKEKEIKDLAVLTTKASDLMKEIEPEKLLASIKKETSKYELLGQKLEIGEAKYSKLIEEVKELRRKTELFKGVDEIIELNKETRNNLITMKATEANMEKHSNKVERMFIQFQKSYNEFEEFKKLVSDTKESFKALSNEFEELKSRIHTIGGLQSGDISKLKELEKLGADVSSLKEQLNAERKAGSANEEKVKEIIKGMGREIAVSKKAIEQKSHSNEKMYEKLKSAVERLKSEKDQLKKELASIKLSGETLKGPAPKKRKIHEENNEPGTSKIEEEHIEGSITGQTQEKTGSIRAKKRKKKKSSGETEKKPEQRKWLDFIWKKP